MDKMGIGKKDLRARLRGERKAISDSERIIFEQELKAQLMPYLCKDKNIAAYLACGSEANLLSWIQTAQEEGGRIFVPFIEENKKRLWFTQYLLQNNVLHSTPHFGIPQYEGEKVRAEDMDVIFLPLVGIDRQGYRLGQGGGYYDASLSYFKGADIRPKLIGVGFSCQLVDSVPVESWDMKLDAFVSEQGVIEF